MRLNTDSIYDVRFWLGVGLLLTALVIGVLFSSSCATPAPAKPSPAPADSVFQSPTIPGMPQPDTEDLLVQWNKAEKKQADAQAEISAYVTLMNGKLKKAREAGAKGLDEGTLIQFEPTRPCVPLEGGGTRCTQVAKVIPPQPPAVVNGGSLKLSPVTPGKDVKEKK